MHKSGLAGFIIDCKTEDLDKATRFWSEALHLPVIVRQRSRDYRKLAPRPGRHECRGPEGRPPQPGASGHRKQRHPRRGQAPGGAGRQGRQARSRPGLSWRRRPATASAWSRGSIETADDGRIALGRIRSRFLAPNSRRVVSIRHAAEDPHRPLDPQRRFRPIGRGSGRDRGGRGGLCPCGCDGRAFRPEPHHWPHGGEGAAPP